MNFLKKIISSQAGMSVAEIAVAAAIAGAGVLGMVQMTGQNAESMKKLGLNSVIVGITNHTHMILQNQHACFNTFGGRTAGQEVDNIKDEMNNVFYAKKTDPDTYLKIGSVIEVIKINLDVADLNHSTFVKPGKAGMLNVKFTLRDGRLPADNPTLIERTIKLWVKTKTDMTIEKCVTPPLFSRNLWQTTFENPDDIYYGNHIAVGGNAPDQPTDVFGRIRFQKEDGGKATIGKGTGNRISFEQAQGLQVSYDKVEPDGTTTTKLIDVMANNIESTNLLQPGSTGGNCNADTRATLRFNQRIRKTQFCDGQYWRSFQSE